MLLLSIALIALVILLVLVARSNDKFEIESYCQSDIPCVECGRCFSDHPGSAFSSHSYVMGNDDLR